ncbi:Pyridoxamine 5'-phosphate oxidase [Rubripirellula tenax]|uniref:Pyridoxamine 5'-phosphate oxidase n=1 Tax=Rubripirellula tenax TaxID=2528015 RepID=A0A5C6F9M5_9BACT|nr:pyridoxamine 5'-phosphate oxidase family protein [Rubripirellula tenax]TWU58453.1 Pyridoxamine 5'-phosphate oxidase [Rubripirellula tenax]
MSASATISEIIQSASVASLGTVTVDGGPFVSLVTIAATTPTTMVMLLSGLAVHTKNLVVSPKTSLLLVQPGGEGGDPLAGARVSLVGSTIRLDRGEDTVARSTFLAKHVSASMYADFGDFSFFEFTVDHAHLVAGFGRIETLSADQL